MLDPMVMLFGVKAIRVAACYISLTITANYMAQIYMDKVLINQENPQHLVNFVSMFAIIDAILFALILGLVFAVTKMVGNVSDGFGLMNTLIQDYMLFSLMVSVSGVIVTTTMHNKKFFMYKDDGLRAIRALKEIMFGLAIFHGIVPYNYFNIQVAMKKSNVS